MKWQHLVALVGLVLVVGSAEAITYDVGLDPGQEVPAPTLGGATPSGVATVDVDTLTGAVSINGSYSGMTSNVSAAHLHGLAGPGVATGVIFGFTVDGGMSGNFNGASSLSAVNLTGLLGGETYLNVHTANNGAGEIRGQVVDPDIRVFDIALGPLQEVPDPDVIGFSPSGSATVVVDISTGEVEILGSYAGMTSNVSAAHLHGLAGPGVATGVIFGLSVDGGTSGAFSGANVLSSENLMGLLNGQTYLNVHTANNGAGEIRGQVPEPSVVGIIVAGLGLIMSRGRKCRRSSGDMALNLR